MTFHSILALLLVTFLLQEGNCQREESDPSRQASVQTAVDSVDEWIVFSSGRSGNGDIYALHPSTRETILVVGSPEPEGTVRYDPARDRIVYHRYEEAPTRVILVSGGQDLFEDPNGDVAPAWSPTGDWIVYAAERDGQEDLFMAQPDGTGEQQLTNDALIDRYPAWSPDGTQVVFARRLETGWDLHTLDPLSNVPVLKRLTNDGLYVGHPAWSPNGLHIAFDTLIDGQAEIAMLDLTTGKITRLTDRAGNDLVPAWALDNGRVVFGGEPDDAGNWDVWMVDVKTLEVERLTSDASYDGGPVFVSASSLGR